MNKQCQNIFLVVLLLFLSCNKGEEPDITTIPSDLVGEYCSSSHTSTFTVELRSSEELFLEESWYANFIFYLVDDRIVIPKQTVKQERSSPGGTTYFIYVVLEGAGIYYAESKTLYFEIHEDNYVWELWLRNHENIPKEGNYHSVENTNDGMKITRIPFADSLSVNLKFEKNELGDTGFIFKVSHNKCYIWEYVHQEDSTYFFVRMQFPDTLVKMTFSKRYIHEDSSETVLYTYGFDMLFEDR